jgi:S-adenosylmethionine:tRNA ribosyltransferase-isomerase
VTRPGKGPGAPGSASGGTPSGAPAGEDGGAGPDLTRTEAWAYELPPELVARYPAERRDGSRLLVVPQGVASGAASMAAPGAGVAAASTAPASAPVDPPFEHRRFHELPVYLRAGDLLVLNESRVLPVRLLGKKPTGAAAEVLLLRPLDDDALRWEAMVRPGSKLKPGRRVVVVPEALEVVIEEGLPDGGRLVRLETPFSGPEALERFGRIPLPPYLERPDEALDRERYQTVYARVPGSVAAPTAGLHFTPELLAAVEARGVEVARVTLHVGPGTFRPVEAERIEGHVMHAERWEVSEATADAVARTRARGGRIWAVGTTVVRTLESAWEEASEAAGPGGGGRVRAGGGETRLFLHPGAPIRVVDGLITNFHLPRSTLLMLVGAFLGHRRTLDAYAEAVQEAYRFYSYGDAMLILPGEQREPSAGG